MAVSRKGRNRLTIADRHYLWWVCPSEPATSPLYSSGFVLNVVSEDRRFYVRFHLGQPAERRHVTILGCEFSGVPEAGGCWVRIQSPDWQTNQGIQPSDVRRLIEWSLHEETPHVRMDWRGVPTEDARQVYEKSSATQNEPIVVEFMDRQMVEIIRSKTTTEKIAMLGAAHRTAKMLVTCGIRGDHPDWSEEQVHEELTRRMFRGTT